MRRAILVLYHFLGGIYFALLLIATVAVIVIAGTFLESSTSSHRYASQFTYGHPLFHVLIACFFINILFSALRRWPFQMRHTPFLITHLGLLMILTGMIAKSLFGLQGSMTLVEGSGSHQVQIPDRIGVRVESRSVPAQEWQLTQSFTGRRWLQPLHTDKGEIALALTGYTSHAKERLELWTKGDHAFIQGLPPVPLVAWDSSKPLPVASITVPTDDPALSWRFQAFSTDQPTELIRRAYLDGQMLVIKDTRSGQLLHQLPLAEALLGPVHFLGGHATIHLDLDVIHVELKLNSQQLPEQMQIALSGPEALVNQNVTTPLLGSLPVEISLQRPATLTLIRDTTGTESLIAFQPNGELSSQTFHPDKMESVYVLDDGFAGYATQCPLPAACPTARERHGAKCKHLQQALSDATASEDLAPPLQLLSAACQAAHEDFASVCLDLLETWDRSHGWLLNPDTPLSPAVRNAVSKLDWSLVSEADHGGCLLASTLTAQLEDLLKQGEDLNAYLTDSGWPFPLPNDASHDLSTVLDSIHRQLFMAGAQVPPEALEKTSTEPVTLLSAYLRAYGLHLSQLPDYPPSTSTPPLFLRTQITAMQIPLEPLTELEKNKPSIALKLRSASVQDTVDLSYDATGKGLKWPVLGGQYLARFQPLRQDIPHHVRLRDARKISYPNSNQPFSYEADVIVTDLRTGQSVETTLSMNRVHETADGYRFYLASIAPAEETAVRQVQLAVNRDPAKYPLTYLGAVVMTLGIVLLFFAPRR